MKANVTLASSHKTVHDVLEALFEGMCVSLYSWTLSVVCATDSSSEVETFPSSSESDDSVSTRNVELSQSVSKPWSNTSDKGGRQWENGILLPSLSFYAPYPTCCNLQPLPYTGRWY